MDYSGMSPQDVRHLIREGKITGPTAGMCAGHAQANLVILPKKEAYDFLLFAQRNPKPCPILEVADEGSRALHYMAEDCDIARDFPKYRVYRRGELVAECTDVADMWRDDFVSFIIGCSFSFEADLLAAGLPVRHIEQGCNVPMYLTNIACKPAGVFSGNMVVSMRPYTPQQASLAVQITAAMPQVHGAPIHIGEPERLGIADIDKPDFGDAVEIRPGEIPVFWPCGVTPQAVVMASKPEIVITHAPGHMLILDKKNLELKY